MAHKTFTPSPQQQVIFDYVVDQFGGNAIVEAVAGAGKTTTLVKACELMKGMVFLGAYNKKIAKEISGKTTHLPNVWSKTFHAMGMNAVTFFLARNDRNAVQVDDKKVRKLIEGYILEKGRADLNDMAATVAKIVGMAKQRGIGVCFADTDAVWLEMIEHFDLASDLPEGYEDRMDIVVKFARVILRRSNQQAKEAMVIDFDDMVYLPLLWNLRLKKFEWVLVDEAQDTNPTRREFAKRLMAPNARFIAVGDPRQAIYGFSGADNNSLEQIARDFNAKRLPLTVTYRCPKEVVKVAQQFVTHIVAHETAPEGLYTEQPYDVLPEQLLPGDAVLCRYNKYLVGLCFRLIRMGKPARIEGRAIGAGLVALTKKWKVKKLDALAERVTKWRDREVTKYAAKQNDTKVQEIEDKAETIFVLIERAQEQGITDTDGLRTMIESLFDDDVADKRGMITLCSVHKSKGLEWNRVFILGLYELMGRECAQDWQTEQEVNLQYVAVTRAQELLVNVTGVKEEKKQHGEGG